MATLKDLSERDVAAIMLRSGMPIKVVAAKVKMSERTVKRIKSDRDIQCTLKPRATKEERHLAISLYKKGLSEAYIAFLLGVRASCLFRVIWKKEGIL